MTNEELLKALIEAQLSTNKIYEELARRYQAAKYTDHNLGNAQSAMDKVAHNLINATTYASKWIKYTGGMQPPENSD